MPAPGNSARIVSAATWAAAPRGSTRSSAMPNLACANGSASVSRSPVTTMPVAAGLRMTAEASRYQTPRPVLLPGSLRRTGANTSSLSMRCPATASTGGRISSVATAASATTAIPA